MRTKIVGIALVGLAAACGGSAVGDPFAGGAAGSGAGGSGGSTTTSSTTSSLGGSGASGFDACTGPGQCVLVSETCCGVCGMPTLDDLVAVHEDQVSAHYAEVCTEPSACPDCPTMANPDVFAYCDQGRCTGVDLSSHPFDSCTGSEQCRLRWGLGCCECTAVGQELTAIPIAFETQLEQLVCKPNTGCPECMPSYPPDAEPYCDNGHCTVMYLDSGSGN